jgi:cytochrome c6
MYFMRKLSLALIMVLLVIASCTKKSAPTATTIKPAIDGAPLFSQNCARCHGATGTEGRAPNLARGDDSKAEIMDKIANGAGRMPAFASKMSGAEIEAVAEFVLHLKK